MTPGDYDILRELSTGKEIIFEFGSHIGGSALAMLPQIVEAKGHLYCFDHFKGNPNDEATEAPPGEVLAAFVDRTMSYRDHVTIVVGDISEVFNFPRFFADMVFIDADHVYDAVCHDIKAALHVTKPGGIISGHDYIKHLDECDPELVEQYATIEGGGSGGVCYGVIKAVNDILGKPEHRSGTAVWWIELKLKMKMKNNGGEL